MFNHTERNLIERQYMFFAATSSLSLNTLPGHSLTLSYVFPFYYSINLHCAHYSTIGVLSVFLFFFTLLGLFLLPPGLIKISYAGGNMGVDLDVLADENGCWMYQYYMCIVFSMQRFTCIV